MGTGSYQQRGFPGRKIVIPAPIAFFAYKRPEHTLLALEALSRCELAAESSLFIYCDGPKGSEDEPGVQKVREVVKSRQWCGKVQIIEHQENVGLARSVITGTTGLCQEYGRVIVLEDDLLISSCFLRYMNEALETYKDEEQVMQVSGHMFNAGLRESSDAIFLSFVTTWGWGTWWRAWRQLDTAIFGYEKLKEDLKLRHRFDLDGNYRYFDILVKQVAGEIDSWGIVWNLSVFMKNGLVLYPVQSMVYNGGFDGSGTHCGDAGPQVFHLVEHQGPFRFPEVIEESAAKHTVYKAILDVNRTSFFTKLKKLKRRLFR